MQKLIKKLDTELLVREIINRELTADQCRRIEDSLLFCIPEEKENERTEMSELRE